MPCLSVFIFLNGFQDLRSLNRAVCYTSRMSFLTYKQSCAVCKLLIWNNPWTAEFYSLPNAGLITSDLQVGNSALAWNKFWGTAPDFLIESIVEVMWRGDMTHLLQSFAVALFTPCCRLLYDSSLLIVELSPHSLINIVCLGQDCSFDKHSHYNHYESTAVL